MTTTASTMIANQPIVDAIVDLQVRGFLFDFTQLGHKLFCAQQKCFFGLEDFVIREKYSFPADRLAGKERTVYGIESLSSGFKGILLK